MFFRMSEISFNNVSINHMQIIQLAIDLLTFHYLLKDMLANTV